MHYSKEIPMEIKFIPPFAEVWPFRAQDFQLYRNTILMIQSLLYSLQPSCAKTLQMHPFCEAFLRCFHENAKEGCGRACLLYLDFAACKKKITSLLGADMYKLF